jgi:Skp family chaperone for outer membrane proteins
MKKNRAHASARLAAKTAGLFSAISDAEKKQDAINKGLAKQTKQARLAVHKELEDAKAGFTKDLGKLSATVAANDKKFDKKMKKLTGIVDDNRAAAKKDRDAIAALQKANKADL